MLLHQVLEGLLWRSTKKQVSAQLQLPQQTEEVCLLRFSSIESEYYRQQHIATREMSRKVRHM
jgi:SNF2-related domain